MVSHPTVHTQVIPVYALSRSGQPLIAARMHPDGAHAAVTRARAAGVEVSADGRLVDGEWLVGDVADLSPDMVPVLRALLIAIRQQGVLIHEMQSLRRGETPAVAS